MSGTICGGVGRIVFERNLTMKGNLFDEYLKFQSEQVVAKQDELIYSVLPENISPLEVANDCKWLYHESRPNEKTLYYKDAPVLTLHDPIFETRHGTDGSVYIHVSQNYIKHR